MAVFYVTLSPLEPYFFGSERKLGAGFSNTRSSYFVQSELVPQQSTLLGMLRFFLLKQAGYVRDDYRTDEELIGKNSFMISSTNQSSATAYTQDFGAIKSISPLFLADQDDKYYIVTPKNHQKYKPVFTPYEMVRMDADGRSDSYLLKDYNGKTGITDSYTRLSDGSIFEVDELFGRMENVGICKKADEDGFYKKEYRYLKMEKGRFRFTFFVSLDSEILSRKLPYFLRKKDTVKDIVYMGLGKSAFSIEVKRKENDFYSQVANMMKRNRTQELTAYYTVSDTLFWDHPDLPFAMIETGSFRYLMTQKDSKNEWGRMRESCLYQVIKPGSMFWVKKGNENTFEKKFDIANCKKIGMNQLIRSEDYESTVNEDKMSD